MENVERTTERGLGGQTVHGASIQEVRALPDDNVKKETSGLGGFTVHGVSIKEVVVYHGKDFTPDQNTLLDSSPTKPTAKLPNS